MSSSVLRETCLCSLVVGDGATASSCNAVPPERLAESRCPRFHKQPHATAQPEPDMFQSRVRPPSSPPHPAKPNLPARGTASAKRSDSPAATDQGEQEAMLDVAEALWWVAVSIGRQHLGIDLSSSPRQANNVQKCTISINRECSKMATKIFFSP